MFGMKGLPKWSDQNLSHWAENSGPSAETSSICDQSTPLLHFFLQSDSNRQPQAIYFVTIMLAFPPIMWNQSCEEIVKIFEGRMKNTDAGRNGSFGKAFVGR
jgi:hypothetical protein